MRILQDLSTRDFGPTPPPRHEEREVMPAAVREGLACLPFEEKLKYAREFLAAILPFDFPSSKNPYWGDRDLLGALATLYAESLSKGRHVEGAAAWVAWREVIDDLKERSPFLRAGSDELNLRQAAMQSYAASVFDKNDYAGAVIFYGGFFRGRAATSDIDLITLSSGYPTDETSSLCAALRASPIEELLAMPEIEQRRHLSRTYGQQLVTKMEHAKVNAVINDEASNGEGMLAVYIRTTFTRQQRYLAKCLEGIGIPENVSSGELRRCVASLQVKEDDHFKLRLLRAAVGGDSWAAVQSRARKFELEDPVFEELSANMRRLREQRPELFVEKPRGMGQAAPSPVFRLSNLHQPFDPAMPLLMFVNGPLMVMLRQADTGAVRTFFSSGLTHPPESVLL